MKTILQSLVALALITLVLYMLVNSPCDDQCKIEGLQADMNKQCYDYRGTNQLCVEHYNNLLAELSTKQH